MSAGVGTEAVGEGAGVGSTPTEGGVSGTTPTEGGVRFPTDGGVSITSVFMDVNRGPRQGDWEGDWQGDEQGDIELNDGDVEREHRLDSSYSG